MYLYVKSSSKPNNKTKHRPILYNEWFTGSVTRAKHPRQTSVSVDALEVYEICRKHDGVSSPPHEWMV